MKSVLFIGLTDYDLKKEDKNVEAKMEGLRKDFQVHVLARGEGGERNKHGVNFYLIPKMFGRLSPLIWGVAALFWGYKIIKKHKVEVLVSQSPTVEGLVALMLSSLTGAKLIIEVHGDFINGPFYYYDLPFSNFLKSTLRAVGGFTLRRADKVRVVSEFLREMVLELAPKAKIVKFIAFTPVDELLAERDISWEPRIVFAGSLYKVKGVDVLIDACLILKDKFPELRLEILGKGPEQEALMARAKPLGERVRFHGYIPIKDVIKSSTVLVLPSRSEGLGRVLVEAAALGKPLIGSRVGGIPEVVKDGINGFLVPSEDVSALAGAISKLLSDQELAKKMGEEGRELVRNQFSTQNFFDGYRDLINDL